MVGVLVGNENGVDGPRVFAAQAHPPQKLAAGEACVHQQAGTGTGDQGAVTFAPARQHRDRHHSRENILNAGFAVVTK